MRMSRHNYNIQLVLSRCGTAKIQKEVTRPHRNYTIHCAGILNLQTSRDAALPEDAGTHPPTGPARAGEHFPVTYLQLP